MTYRRALRPIRIGLLLVAPLLVVFACVGTTAPTALNEASSPSLSDRALDPADSERAQVMDSPVSSPETIPCVRPPVHRMEIRGRTVSLPESICVVATYPGRVKIQVRDGYSWVEINTLTGDVVDGDLYVEEKRHFAEFEVVAGRRLYDGNREKEHVGPATAPTQTPGIAPKSPSPPRNDVTPGGSLLDGALTPTATATHVPLDTMSPAPAATHTPASTTSRKAPAATQTPEPADAPTPLPSATPVVSPAADVVLDISPTASPTPEATPTPDAVDDGPRQVCDYSGTEQPVIKGNIGSGGERIFHTPDSAYYGRTEIEQSKGEVWFCTEAAALSAGWRPPMSNGAGSATSTPAPVEPHSININLASAVELELLPGIGKVKAQAIVEYRVLNGPFTSVEGLLGVKGIGPVTLDKVRDLITIE